LDADHPRKRGELSILKKIFPASIHVHPRPISLFKGNPVSQSSYDYSTRKGVLPISWEDFHTICKALALAVSRFAPQLLLPIGRGGYYPGTLLAHLLQVELHPVRLSRRVNDVVRFDTPQWILEPPAAVSGCRVLVVDEVSSSGETLSMAIEKCLSLGAMEVQSAVLYAHARGAEVPNYIGIITDKLILNPWDREIIKNGEFIFHPEYVAALKEQSLEATPGLLTCTSGSDVGVQSGEFTCTCGTGAGKLAKG
jgi:hypoxanthine phosphoribosyltransferase